MRTPVPWRKAAGTSLRRAFTARAGSGSAGLGVEDGQAPPGRDEQSAQKPWANGDFVGQDGEATPLMITTSPQKRHHGSCNRRRRLAGRHRHEPDETGEEADHEREGPKHRPPEIRAEADRVRPHSHHNY